MPGAAGDDHDRDEAHEDPDEHDEHDDAPPLGNPPHPLDRIWRHPSELPPAPVGLSSSPKAQSRRDLGHVWVALAAAGAGALATFVILAAFGVFDDGTQAPTARRAEQVRVTDAAVAQLAADIAPSIVAVSVVGPEGMRRGSGVCVRNSGDILTSERLVRGGTRITVTSNDGEIETASLLGDDQATDLALLHVGGGIQAAPIAERGVRAGDTVLAVSASGTAGKQPWIGDGIVASIDGVAVQLGGPAMDGMIATNAAAGKTGLGGALLDRQGTVAGIVVAPLDGDRSTYAVPIRRAAEVAEQLSRRGTAQHGWLGAQGVDANGAPMITAVNSGGPAERGGLEVGDVVIAVGGRPVATMGEVTAAVRWYDPRSVVSIKVLRGERIVNVTVTVGATKPDSMLAGV
jgi:S1-C subfamily serine protease